MSTDNTDAYNTLKTAMDIKHGIHNICFVNSKLIKEKNQYFNKFALKFNLKLGSVNQLVDNIRLDIINERKTMMIGIDFIHSFPGSIFNAPSIAGMVASVNKVLGQWSAAARFQNRRDEIVDDLNSMLKSPPTLWRK